MKNLILFIFSILVFFVTNAQEINYLVYHKNCRKAELYFLNNDTVQCINAYKTTFDSFEILFPRDCFMAAKIASKLGQDSMAVEFILKGIPFGLNPEFFSNGNTAHQIMNYKITKLTETKYWQCRQLLWQIVDCKSHLNSKHFYLYSPNSPFSTNLTIRS